MINIRWSLFIIGNIIKYLGLTIFILPIISSIYFHFNKENYALVLIISLFIVSKNNNFKLGLITITNLYLIIFINNESNDILKIYFDFFVLFLTIGSGASLFKFGQRIVSETKSVFNIQNEEIIILRSFRSDTFIYGNRHEWFLSLISLNIPINLISRVSKNLYLSNYNNIVVSNPSEILSLLFNKNVYYKSNEWKTGVSILIKNSRAIIMLVDSSQGVLDELDMIGNEYLYKLILIKLPNLSIEKLKIFIDHLNKYSNIDVNSIDNSLNIINISNSENYEIIRETTHSFNNLIIILKNLIQEKFDKQIEI